MNVTGTQRIAEVFGNDIPVIYLSTDLVFSGENPPRGGYVEHHHPDPVSVAGKTFMHAEKYIRSCQEHCTIRLGLPLGSSVTGDKGAIDWIESRFKKNLPVTLFTDEFRSCVPCEEIGRMVTAALKKGVRGLYHYGGGESWSLHAIGEYVITRGNYPRLLLRGIKRSEEIGGPPRIGEVSLNSTALRTILG
jgi:dTDP-4-dehydrorhamnose reductase